jgi:hypothetical protein
MISRLEGERGMFRGKGTEAEMIGGKQMEAKRKAEDVGRGASASKETIYDWKVQYWG